jgi:hypothetical protein
MATYFVWSGAGGANDGSDWTNAYTGLASALSAATTTGDTIKIASAHSEEVSGDTTFTIAGDVKIVCVDKDSSDALATGALIHATSTSYSIAFTGAKRWYMRGVTLRVAGTGIKTIAIASGTDIQHAELENCRLEVTTTNNSSSVAINLGANGFNSYCRLANSVLKFGAASHRFNARGGAVLEGVSIDSAGTKPNSSGFIETAGLVGVLRFIGCDLTWLAGTIFIVNSTARSEVEFINCTMPPSYTMIATQAQLTKANLSVSVFNSSSGDTHYNFAHYDAFGSTEAVATYYADDTEPTGNNVSWKITTTANALFHTPYVSPWFDRFNDNTSTAITPAIEGLRVDSTTVIQNDEVWAEFSYQGTSGYPQAVFVNGRMALLGSPANCTSSKAYSDWTGSPTDTDSADSTFKLVAGTPSSPTSFTPAEIGDLSARIVVGEPSLTIYIDPVIRT